MAINKACNEIGKQWFESGVSENAVSGHIQFIRPGFTACFACAPPLVVASDMDEKSLKREGVCAASLPTTMAIVAGLLVQNALKLLLEFGEPSHYLGYNALVDFFPKTPVKPNPECDEFHCVKRQKAAAEILAQQLKEHKEPEKVEEEIVHEDNEWGISLVSEDAGDVDGASNATELAAGVKLAYEKPKRPQEVEEETQAEDKESLEDLMKQLKKL